MPNGILRILTALLGVATFMGCGSKMGADLPAPVSVMEQPASFGTPVFGADPRAVTEAGFQLGRALFYDPALSIDSTVSCGSCHKQTAAFADPGQAVSAGIGSQPTRRNSPTIQNMAWRTSFMWDGRIATLHNQPIGPISNPGEMGPDFAAIVTKVAAYPRYKTLCKAAYKVDTLTDNRLLDGLAQFMGSLVSAHSRYDAHMAGDSAALSGQEKLGLQVFMGKGCNNCHRAPLFAVNDLKNNGLDDYSIDGGLYAHTNNEADRGKFAVPILRNVAKSAPYMHDGRFATLNDVVAFYRTGIQASPTKDVALPTGGIAMTDTEATALVAFLKSLTDEAFLTNGRYGKP